MPGTSDHFLLICSTCIGALPLEDLRDALVDKLPGKYSIRTVACMAGCDRPTTVGFQAVGKAHYLFGDILTTQGIDALAEFAHQYRDSADGWTNATERPPELLKKTLSRLPCLNPEVLS